ncbi:unnamed protein product [Urochloa humidicola]
MPMDPARDGHGRDQGGGWPGRRCRSTAAVSPRWTRRSAPASDYGATPMKALGLGISYHRQHHIGNIDGDGASRRQLPIPDTQPPSGGGGRSRRSLHGALEISLHSSFSKGWHG